VIAGKGMAKPFHSEFRPALRGVQGCPEPYVVQGAIRNRLIVFTRFPEPGKCKTRLIPALGPQIAADLHRKMTEHTLSWARRWNERFSGSLQVHFTGGIEESFHKWLGSDVCYRPQSGGDLGSRMQEAFHQAFREGMARVVLVGTDCPGLNEDLCQKAFEELHRNEVVLGPARDGGYYLIGLQRPTEELFREIPWGTGEVLAKTRAIARKLNLSVFLLEAMQDVDHPEDLPIWERISSASSLPSRFEREGKRGEDSPSISIIIPTLNEEKNIEACLASCGDSPHTEKIVVDGGSLDRTAAIARSLGARVILSPRGRGRQMNLGAREAAGDFLLFLHADTRLAEGFADCVREVLSRPGISAGAFLFRLDAWSPGLCLIQKIANWRSRVFQFPYGDQAIFLKRGLFQEVGGYPEMPIMEDFELIRRLKRRGRVFAAPLPALTSARRWKEVGIWQTTILNQVIVLAYYLRVSPRTLARWYRRF